MLHGDLLGERAALSPDKTALVCVATGARFTFGQLARRARRMAALWHDTLGLRPGDRVAILAHNRVEFLDAFFAAGCSGVVLVPLGTRLTSRELQHILVHSGAAVVLYDGALAEPVSALAELECPVRKWVCLDRPARSDHEDLGTLMEQVPDDPPRLPPAHPEDLYCLLYTSGTTGKPKGVMTPHRMVAWNAFNTVLSWQLQEDDVSPVFTPLYHAGGLGAFLTAMVAVGGTVVLHAGFDPAEIWRTVGGERCTVILGVPTIWKLLMEAPEFAGADLSSVRWLISGGAPLPLYIIQAYQRRGVVFKQGYGLTEVGVNCFAMSVEDSVRKAGTIGRPMMFTRAKLVDEEGREVPAGEIGELLLRGPHVCQGYWNDLEATSAALDRDGWFHTGDLARRDPEGFFTIAGRRKDMLISGGVNIYPAEIEGELLLHPAVQDAAVVGVPDPTWGETGVACVVLRPGHSVSGDELVEFLGRTLARYKIPREFLFLAELPRTSYGKVLKGDLRELWQAGQRR